MNSRFIGIKIGGTKLRIVVGGLVILFFALFACLALKSHEPSYKGKTLSQWLVEAEKNGAIYYPEADTEAVDAIRQIGTNGLPTLIRLAAAEDSATREKLVKWKDRFNQKQNLFHIRLSSEYEKRELSEEGFFILRSDAGPALGSLMALSRSTNWRIQVNAIFCMGCLGAAAKPAVPALIKEYEREETNLQSSRTITWALGEIGPSAREAAPSLNHTLTNGVGWRPDIQAALIKMGAMPIYPFIEKLKDFSDVSNWVAAVPVLMRCGTNAAEAVPALIEWLKDSRADQTTVLHALGEIHQRPDISVPVIIPFLQHPDADFRECAINNLRRFGRTANAATPALLHCLADPELKVRRNATNAVLEINPEVAAKLWKK